MNQSDEMIIKLQNEIKKEEEKSKQEEVINQEINSQSIFEDNITVYSIPIKFSYRDILYGKAKVCMPIDFEELDEEEIATIYPLGNKPQAVYGNTYFDLSIGFNHTMHSLPNDMMVEFRNLVKLVLEKSGPKVRIFKEDEITKNKGKSDEFKITILEFASHTLMDVIYNIMFFISIENRVMIGSINFNMANLKRHKPIAIEMIKSLQIIKGE